MNFEESILEKMDKMNDSLATLNERLTVFEGRTEKALVELSGKIKGNHELIITDLNRYTDKDTCATYRENHGTRVSAVEERLIIVETLLKQHTYMAEQDKNNHSEALIAWLPDVIKAVIVIGGILVALANGWLKFGG